MTQKKASEEMSRLCVEVWSGARVLLVCDGQARSPHSGPLLLTEHLVRAFPESGVLPSQWELDIHHLTGSSRLPAEVGAVPVLIWQKRKPRGVA